MTEASHNSYLALEDDFNDIVSKAARGRQMAQAQIVDIVGEPAANVAMWFTGKAVPSPAIVDVLADALHLRRNSLRSSAERTWHPKTNLPANVQSYVQHAQPESNGYLIRGNDGKEIALVDPAGNVDALVLRVEAAALPLRYLLITHRHDDHADAAAELTMRYPDVEIIMHAAEAMTRSELPRLQRTLHDGDRLPFGGSDIRILFTGGHTDGSICFYFDRFIAVGDTLFSASVGRTNGPTVTYIEHLANIRERIFTLPDDIIILPGHGPTTTVGHERASNPFFPEKD